MLLVACRTSDGRVRVKSVTRTGRCTGTHGGAAPPGADDVLAGREDVDDGAVVGERGARVRDRARADGDDGGRTRGAVVRGVRVEVAGGDGNVDALVDDLEEYADISSLVMHAGTGIGDAQR